MEDERRPVGVATYNVHGFVGLDGVRDPERTTRVLEELDADVVGLQEVLYPPGHEVLGRMAKRLGVEVVLGPTLEHDAGPYGNALLTRLPVRRVHRLDLSVAGREPRGAIDCVLDAHGVPLRVLATHLGLRARERRSQVHRLAAALQRPGPAFVLMLGDMNEWRRRTGALARLVGPSARPRSFPTWRPTLALDRIWARPSVLLHRVAVHRSHLALQASDHLPVRGELRLAHLARGLHCDDPEETP